MTNLKIRIDYLEKMFDYKIGNEDFIVSAKTMRKELKRKINVIYGRT